MNVVSIKTPTRVKVAKLISSRYLGNKKPLSWDERTEGVDVVQTSDGTSLRLLSDGGQAPPQEGWDLMLTEVTPDKSYRWTLYGLS